MDNLFSDRKSLDRICTVPDSIISVYALEQHIWAASDLEKARRARQPELQTVEEFQIDPVRPFLTDVLRHLAAPHKPERRDDPVGQGYWIQAEFGSGKSHLLCFLAALALGKPEAWDIIRAKEQKAGRGKRESLYRFWEEGLAAKSSGEGKGILVIARTLVGVGGGAVGLQDTGRRLSDYILEAAKDQLFAELGKNLSLYPTELLADRFIQKDLERYRRDLQKFLRDSRYFEEDEFQEVDEFVEQIQENRKPEYKRSCGNKLWRFYTEYLQVQPQIAAEAEEILEHVVRTALGEGYAGVLIILDEVSMFMKNRDPERRDDDERTLVVLANRLAKVKNLPVWTVCAAQQAIESKLGVKNIIADDRLKLVKLLENDKEYYEIVLARVREITDPKAISGYFQHYKRGFSWPQSMGEEEFAYFFPFHRPAIEVLRAITYELTTTRSAIHFMHQTLRHQIKAKGQELIRLWELFDEAVHYEEDPSGTTAGLAAIKTKRESEYKAYEACRRQIDSATKGALKVHRDKAVRTLQTLFLYHISRTRQQGLTSEEIANAVLIPRDDTSDVQENMEHYETLVTTLKKELRQVVEGTDNEGQTRYRFDPVITGIDPRVEFEHSRNEVESNQALLQQAWEHLLALDEWPVKTRQLTFDLSGGVRSPFRDVAPFVGAWEDRGAAESGDQDLDVVWLGRVVSGRVGMRDLRRVAAGEEHLPPITSDETDNDFALFVSSRVVSAKDTAAVLKQVGDPRVIVWAPDDLTADERQRLVDFAAYRKLIDAWQGKDSEDAMAVINWVAEALTTDMAKIAKIVEASYARGHVDALNHQKMQFHVAGDLKSIVAPLVDRVLTATYTSRDLAFPSPFQFRKEEAVKVINGIVRTGSIPKNAKPNQDISAVQNFGPGLGIVKKGNGLELDVAGCRYVKALEDFITAKLTDDRQSMKVETLLKNFMGRGGPEDFGLTRRMVQLFLMCLVKTGKVRVGLGPRSGLSISVLDATSIGSVDFSARVLDALTDVRRVSRPESWDALRPYAEKLLGVAIPHDADVANIGLWRANLRTVFTEERDAATRLPERADGLFDVLKTPNPYSTETKAFATLFSSNLSGGDDVALALNALSEAFGYNVFQRGTPDQGEVDDLGVRLSRFRALQKFATFDRELRTAAAYVGLTLPSAPELEDARRAQQSMIDKLGRVQELVDSEVKLRTETLGQLPPQAGERGTLGVLITAYTAAYCAVHDRATGALDDARQTIASLRGGDELRALEVLEGIEALKPLEAPVVHNALDQLVAALPECGEPSRQSIERALKETPVHTCGLTFESASEWVHKANDAAAQAQRLISETLLRKLQILMSTPVRERLEQGTKERAIAAILACESAEQLRQAVLTDGLATDDVVALVNRYLKKVSVRRVKLADFKPTLATVDSEHLADVVEDFQSFLEGELKAASDEPDSVPVLQLE